MTSETVKLLEFLKEAGYGELLKISRMPPCWLIQFGQDSQHLSWGQIPRDSGKIRGSIEICRLASPVSGETWLRTWLGHTNEPRALDEYCQTEKASFTRKGRSSGGSRMSSCSLGVAPSRAAPSDRPLWAVMWWRRPSALLNPFAERDTLSR